MTRTTADDYTRWKSLAGSRLDLHIEPRERFFEPMVILAVAENHVGNFPVAADHKLTRDAAHTVELHGRAFAILIGRSVAAVWIIGENHVWILCAIFMQPG